MIASLGGAIVRDDGSRNYPGSGGLVGGLSEDGGNWAYFSGAGKQYNRFTPQNTFTQNLIDVIDIDTDRNGGGGGPYIPPTGGGFTPSPPSTTPAPNPDWSASVNAGNYFSLPNSPYRHLSGITSGGNRLIAALNSIFGQYQAGSLSLSQATILANQLRGYLSNPSVFYQAQSGRDASALANFKTQAANIINAIVSWVAPAPTTPPANNPAPCNGIPNCNGTTPNNPTEIPTELPSGILALLASLTNTPRTRVEAPPNLYQFTPPSDGSFSTQGSNNMTRNVVIVIALIAVAYFLYKKYA